MKDKTLAENRGALGFGDLWSIQESLLQSYRRIFITAESVLFGLATFVVAWTHASIWIEAPIILLGLGLIPIWMPVCNARARAVTFIHWLIQRYENGEQIEQPYSRFRELQEDPTVQREVEADADFRRLRNSKTRRRIDREVPILFGIMWLVLAFAALL